MTATATESTPRDGRSSEPWRSLAILALVALIAFVRGEPPSPKPVDAPADEFSAARAAVVLSRVFGSIGDPRVHPTPSAEPHAVGTPAHERVRECLVVELARTGLAAEVQEAFVAGPHSNVALVRNVLARIHGRESTPAVLLAAHYDSVPAGPGAGDDGAGVAALLEIARILSSGPMLRHDVILLFTDGEELGLLGARAFCAEHPWAKEVAVAINLEGRGTCGPSEMFETSEDNASLMEVFGRVVPRPSASSLAYEVYKRMPNDTDMTVFKQAGMAGFNFAFIGGVRRYHTPLDDLAHLDLGSLQHHGDNALALVLALTSENLPKTTPQPREIELSRPQPWQSPKPLSPESAQPSSSSSSTSAERVAYTDILGFTLVSWPEKIAVPIAVVELMCCAWCAYRLLRSRAFTGPNLGRGMLLWLGPPLVAALFALASMSGYRALSAYPEPWAGRLPLMAAFIASAALCATCLLASTGGARRIGIVAAWLGAWSVVAILGVAVAMLVPSASYLLAIPGAVAAVACIACAGSPERLGARLERGLVWAPLGAAAVVWIPLAIGLERAVEYRASAANASLIGALFACAAPAWIAAPRGRVMLLGCIAGLGALLLGAVLVLSAPGSTDEPAALNFARIVDADRREEHWVASSFGWPLPASVREAGAFEPELAMPLPVLRWWTYEDKVHASNARASSAGIDALAPACEVSEARAKNAADSRASTRELRGEREVHLSIHSRRAARGILLRASKGVAIEKVALHGREILLHRGASLAILGAENESINVVVSVAADADAEIEIADSMRLQPAEGRPLLDARPPDRVPRGEGDVSVVIRRFSLNP